MSDKRKTIFRQVHESQYVAISRQTAQDKTLSYDASGMLTYILSKSDTWEVQPKDLERKDCKRDKVYKILKELIAARYIKRTVDYDDAHKITAFVYEVYEKPFTENPDMEIPYMENAHISKDREVKKTEKKLTPSKPKPAKKTTSYSDVPDATLKEIIHAWESNLTAKPVNPYAIPKNRETAADIFRAGFTAENVSAFVLATMKEEWWQGKTLTLRKVAELMPGWLKTNSAAPQSVFAGLNFIGENNHA
jgi:hypothetical protein